MGKMSPTPRIHHLLSFGLGIFFGVTMIFLESGLRESTYLIDTTRTSHVNYSMRHFKNKYDSQKGKVTPTKEVIPDYIPKSVSNVVAEILNKNIRVLCWIMTSPGNIRKKAIHVNATWGKRCTVLLFMSSANDSIDLSIVNLPVKEGRNNLWGKTKEAFKYVYKHHMNDSDWFLKADDDTYVIMENLRLLLSKHDSKRPIYFGHRFKKYVKQGYMSGGGGYLLSKEALKRLVENGINKACRNDSGGFEDVEIGFCLEKVGVIPEDSRDSLQQETFHPVQPEKHLIPSKTIWLIRYDYYPIKQGPTCCSNYSITFHYIGARRMYVWEFLLYKLRPFGIQALISNPLEASEQPKQ